ncbi:hypothetical protein EN868_11635 [Mesorhizobium sp. M2D.F.Ca.ET.225.01.1.1]|uniref:hypothetical protein n=1 Tax=unclassified Mesorhizobium TaxID=325217 RepID=UPI000FD3D910|nr:MULTISPECIES: hypothetical protein [unclassified Mesorhizobium]TGP55767.1 hypothetical protein EN869_025445 [Mesorhizobium sp. M2D.F.Ca.ET.226.01.1.1]TGP68225.1 hypothetical protein EN868_11635 [Mesorhizobium sp. M2D.F.Ca.ET.225.01.1.1]
MTIRPTIPNIDDVFVGAAVRHLTQARNSLQRAVLCFDDAGYEHEPTTRLYSFAAGVVSEFAGRQWRPVPPAVPSYFGEAAAEWRRQARRSY